MPTISMAVRSLGIDGKSIQNEDVQDGTIRVSGSGFPDSATVTVDIASRAAEHLTTATVQRDGTFSVDIALPKLVADDYASIPNATWNDTGNVWAVRAGLIKMVLSCDQIAAKGEAAQTVKDRVKGEWLSR